MQSPQQPAPLLQETPAAEQTLQNTQQIIPEEELQGPQEAIPISTIPAGEEDKKKAQAPEDPLKEPKKEKKMEGKRKIRVRDYDWKLYSFEEKEINYVRDFLLSHKGKKVLKGLIGLDEEEAEKPPKQTSNPAPPSNPAKPPATEPAPSTELGKRKPLGLKVPPGRGKEPVPNAGIGTKKLMDVAQSLEARLIKYGRLSEDTSVIKRKQHNNFDFYEQCDFIDDPNDPMILQSMSIVTSNYNDYIMVKGGIDTFVKSKVFESRIDEVKQRNRGERKK